MRSSSSFVFLAATVLEVALTASCGGGDTEPTPAVASVTVSPASLSLGPGETGSLTAEPRAANGTLLTGRTVAWTSSDLAVATVSSQGQVSALAVGSATLTATVEGKSGTAQVVVAYPPAATVVVLPEALSLQPSQTGQFTAEGRNPAGNAIPGKIFTWVVSNPLVATISQTGVVSTLIPGTTTVTASVDGKIGSATLTVVPGPVATVEVTPAENAVEVTKTVQLVAVARDAGGFPVTDQPVTWVSSAPSVASVSATGLVTALVPGGPVNVTAEIAGRTGAAIVTVVPGPAATVTVSPSNSTLEVGQSVQLAVTAKDAQGNLITNRPIAWTSAIPTTATVSATGLVSALAPGGPVTISATIDGVAESAAVTVIPAAVATVEVSPRAGTVPRGGAVQLTATARAANGSVLTGRSVEWVSSNPAVASVSLAAGLVTGVSVGGPVTITATIEGKSANATIRVVPLVVAVSAGYSNTCVLKYDGEVSCWGFEPSMLTPPQGPFVQMSVGGAHACARTASGTLACWGLNFLGQATPPPGTFRDVSAGSNHSCAVRTAGSLACWPVDSTLPFDNGPTAAPKTGSYAHVRAGPENSCAIRVGGSLVCWGRSGEGQLAVPPGTFLDVGIGLPHLCALRSDRTIACWAGDNVFGTLNAPSGQFTQLAVGPDHSCALRSDGTAVCWGYNAYGQAAPPSGTFVQVAVGSFHTCGVRPNGSVVCWGRNVEGQSSVPPQFR